MDKPILSGVGAVVAAAGSMLCCTGPLVAAAAGLSGAGLAAFLPYRPVFVLASIGLLWYAFREIDRGGEAKAAPDVDGCDVRARRRTRVVVLGFAVASAILLSAPLWDDLIFRT
jgi:hypothetical protein